jgi:hypothetical protein
MPQIDERQGDHDQQTEPIKRPRRPDELFEQHTERRANGDPEEDDQQNRSEYAHDPSRRMIETVSGVSTDTVRECGAHRPAAQAV